MMGERSSERGGAGGEGGSRRFAPCWILPAEPHKAIDMFCGSCLSGAQAKNPRRRAANI